MSAEPSRLVRGCPVCRSDLQYDVGTHRYGCLNPECHYSRWTLQPEAHELVVKSAERDGSDHPRPSIVATSKEWGSYDYINVAEQPGPECIRLRDLAQRHRCSKTLIRFRLREFKVPLVRWNAKPPRVYVREADVGRLNLPGPKVETSAPAGAAWLAAHEGNGREMAAATLPPAETPDFVRALTTVGEVLGTVQADDPELCQAVTRVIHALTGRALGKGT